MLFSFIFTVSYPSMFHDAAWYGVSKDIISSICLGEIIPPPPPHPFCFCRGASCASVLFLFYLLYGSFSDHYINTSYIYITRGWFCFVYITTLAVCDILFPERSRGEREGTGGWLYGTQQSDMIIRMTRPNIDEHAVRCRQQTSEVRCRLVFHVYYMIHTIISIYASRIYHIRNGWFFSGAVYSIALRPGMSNKRGRGIVHEGIIPVETSECCSVARAGCVRTLRESI